MTVEPFTVVKTASGITAAVVAVPGAADALSNAERIILGAPQSNLSVALAGVLIGVMLLPEKDARRITPDTDTVGFVPRATQMGARLAAMALLIAAYALVAAWLVGVIAHFVPSLAGAPQLPLCGILGVTVRRLLPSWVKMIERKTTTEGHSK